MLTGLETLAAVAAATGHRHGQATAVGDVDPGGASCATTWAELLGRVRLVALGLAGDGTAGAPGVLGLPRGASTADRAVVLLAAAATGRVVALAGDDVDGAVHHVPDLAALAASGAHVDAGHPGRFEALVGERSPGAPLLRSDGLLYSQASLLLAARSLAQGAGLDADDRLLVALPEGVAQVVASLVVPCLAATPAWVLDPAATPGSGLSGVRPTLTLVAGPGAERSDAGAPARARLRALARRRSGPVPSSRIVRVVEGARRSGAAGAPVADGALSVVAAGGLVSAFGPPGSLGRPLPGVSLAIDDDGAVLVRGPGAAIDPSGRRSDGWIPTGLHGRLDGGVLHPAAGPAPAPAAAP